MFFIFSIFIATLAYLSIGLLVSRKVYVPRTLTLYKQSKIDTDDFGWAVIVNLAWPFYLISMAAKVAYNTLHNHFPALSYPKLLTGFDWKEIKE